MTANQIMTALKKKQYEPVYLLMGEEPYFIDLISGHIEKKVLNDVEKSFNQTVLYGKDTTAAAIDNAARRFPMNSDYQVIIVKEAQDLRDIEKLQFYASKPTKSTILVLNYKYKTIRQNSKLAKAIKKNGIIFESKKKYEDQIPQWITSYLTDRKISIEPMAAMMLTEFLGTQLSKIANELDKLIISMPEQSTITTSDIETNIGISKDFNNFELQKALAKREILKANRIIDYFSKNERDNPIFVTISILYMFFSKLLAYHFLKDKSKRNAASKLKVNPYFVNDYVLAAKRYNPRKTVEIIGMLREYDLKSKGVGNVSTTHGDLLKELVFKIMH